MMATSAALVWFRRDLRVEDNPALVAASRIGPVVPVYIWCPNEEGLFYPGRVSRWWLKESLVHLDSSLQSLGASLILKKAHDTLQALLEIVRSTGTKDVFYNHLYDPISIVRDHRIKQGLLQQGISVHTFNGDLLYEPWEVHDDNGHIFTTFEGFWQKCTSMPFEPEAPLLPPRRLVPISYDLPTSSIEELNLEDSLEKSSNSMLAREWMPGWSLAEKALQAFLSGPLADYAVSRKKANTTTTSKLSPHLHFGELSVRKIFHAVRMKQVLWVKEGKVAANESANLFLRAVGLRDYSRYLCFNFPFTHERSLLANLKNFPWRNDEGYFKAWKQGRTGYPLVDAGMRELWATGWLHNRIRVVVSSFCVKFLQLPWRWGMKYFWDTLLDADLECDVLGWQYISGSLPDGYELDRMESPEVEGYNLDPDGEYVRKWLPELSRLPSEWVHHPWDAPPGILQAAGVELGCNYPRPIVEITAARDRLQQSLAEMWRLETTSRINSSEGRSEGLWNIPSTVHRVNQNVHGNLNDEGNREISLANSQPDQLVPTMCPSLVRPTSATNAFPAAVAAQQKEKNHLPNAPNASLQSGELFHSIMHEECKQNQVPGPLPVQPTLEQCDKSKEESASSSLSGENGNSSTSAVPISPQKVSPELTHLPVMADIKYSVPFNRQLQSSSTCQSVISNYKGEKRGSGSGRQKYWKPTKRQATVDN